MNFEGTNIDPCELSLFKTPQGRLFPSGRDNITRSSEDLSRANFEATFYSFFLRVSREETRTKLEFNDVPIRQGDKVKSDADRMGKRSEIAEIV